MKPSFPTIYRVLAIDPYSKGFGFAVMEAPLQLIDFGLKTPARNKGSLTNRLKKAEVIIGHYLPDVVVVEDRQAKEPRRRHQARTMLRGIEKLALDKNIQYIRLSRSAVHEVITGQSHSTKYEVATKIVEQFRELEPYLPLPRKLWMSESETMNIFDAAALGLAILLRRSSQETLDVKPVREEKGRSIK